MEVNNKREEAESRVVDDDNNQNKKLSCRLVKMDSFDMEIGSLASAQGVDWMTMLKLAFQSIGVVYGDIGTSPLYVLQGVFPNGITNNDDLLGVLALIIYSITLITLTKYVFVVLSANDNGNGGTFALYSLICRYAKVSFIPNQQAEDKDVSNYKLDVPNRRLKRACAVKSMLEKSNIARHILLFMTMLGTSMVIGDGILTPCISVLSAVGGIKEATPSVTNSMIMWISVVILIFVFQIQRFGTDKVGYTFAPILTIWFFSLGAIGLYNFIKYDPSVLKALNPLYIVHYFRRNKKKAWISLGDVVLCISGSEALFADLGHFSVRSIRISACSIVFPSIILVYIGQVSYLRKHNHAVFYAFYNSIPKPVYWPMFVAAVMAAIIASQSLISASFSIVQQSMAMGCFPRVKVVHTSSKYEGQVYVPEINTLLMLACVAVTLAFKDTTKIGNAYGIAVICVYTLTSSFLVLVMIMIWKTNVFLIILYIIAIWLVELLYLSSVLYKFVDGGYFPLVLSGVLMIIMYTWNFGYRKKYNYELENMVSATKLIEVASDPSIHRVPGLALFYTEIVQGISPIFTHYIANVPALHSVVVFVSIKVLQISKVPLDERFLFKRVEPYDLDIFRCAVRYGYADAKDASCMVEMLVSKLKEFTLQNDQEIENVGLQSVVHLIGESEVMAKKGSSFGKRMAIDYGYNWLKRCVSQKDQVLMIPHKRLLKVGITYEV